MTDNKLILGMTKKQLREFAKLNYNSGQQAERKRMMANELNFLEQLREVRGYSKTYLAKKIDIRIEALKKEVEK